MTVWDGSLLLQKGKPTLIDLLVFLRGPRAHLPMLLLDCLVERLKERERKIIKECKFWSERPSAA